MGYFRRRLRSVGFAVQGIHVVVVSQANARLHLVAAIFVIVAAFCSGLTLIEWALLMLAIGMVWTAEALNTAIEFVVDLASPDKQLLAEQAKDTAAGGVLLASIFAAAVGLIVFLPRWL